MLDLFTHAIKPNPGRGERYIEGKKRPARVSTALVSKRAHTPFCGRCPHHEAVTANGHKSVEIELETALATLTKATLNNLAREKAAQPLKTSVKLK